MTVSDPLLYMANEGALGRQEMTKPLIHIGYLTLHLPSGRFYIGIHSTADPDDGYLGSGPDLLKAIRANGQDHFRRFEIARFESRAAASDWEAAVVSSEVVSNPMSFNLSVGGGNPQIPAERPSGDADSLPIFAPVDARPSPARPSPPRRRSTASAERRFETLRVPPVPEAILVPPPPSRVCIG